jgi:uncharacterized protein YcbX
MTSTTSTTTSTGLRVASLATFPLKGARGIDHARIDVGPEGLSGDRRCVLVDDDGRFVTARELPALAALTVVPTARGLRLGDLGDLGNLDGVDVVDVVDVVDPAARTPAAVVDVRLWKHTVPGIVADDATNRALSARLSRRVRLVALGAARQPVDPAWLHDVTADNVTADVDERAVPAVPAAIVTGFADGFPVLVTTEASRRAVADEAGIAVAADRFRANIVVDGATAWDEDTWATLRMGSVRLALVKPCARCVVTTIDPATGTSAGPEPLATLARLRRSADPRVDGVLFGWNAVVVTPGVVATGDAVVVERTRPRWPLRAVSSTTA